MHDRGHLLLGRDRGPALRALVGPSRAWPNPLRRIAPSSSPHCSARPRGRRRSRCRARPSPAISKAWARTTSACGAVCALATPARNASPAWLSSSGGTGDRMQVAYRNHQLFVGRYTSGGPTHLRGEPRSDGADADRRPLTAAMIDDPRRQRGTSRVRGQPNALSDPGCELLREQTKPR